MTLVELFAYVKDGGQLALLLLFIVGGFRAWWVWGWHHREVVTDLKQRLADERADKNEWKSIARSAGLAAETTSIAAVKIAQKQDAPP